MSNTCWVAKKLHRVDGQGFRLHTVFRQRVFLQVFRHQNQDERLNIDKNRGDDIYRTFIV